MNVKRKSAKSTKSTSKKNARETTSARKKARALKIMWESFCNITEVCAAVDIDRKTFYKWKENDESFAEQVEACYEHRLDVAEKALMDRISEGSETSLIFFLKTQGKRRGYVERSELSATFDGSVSAKLGELSDEELQQKFDDLKRKMS